MQILKTLLLSILLVSGLSIRAQIAFEKTYGNSQEEHGEGIVQLADSSYVVVGSTSSFGDLSTDLLLVRIDSSGNVMWSKAKGGSNVDRGMEIIHTSDGNLAMVGFTNSYGSGGYDVYFLKTNYDGNTLLWKTFGGTDWDLAYSLTETSDGGFVIGGETYSSGAGANDAFLLKIDALGDSVWSQTYGGTGSDIAWSVEEAMNGDLLFAGETNSFGVGMRDAWIQRLDNLGNVIWSQTYGDTDDDVGTDVAEMDNGNIMFTRNTIVPGNTYWSAKQSKINPTNGLQMAEQNLNSPYDMFGTKIIDYPNRAATIAVGYLNPFFVGNDMWFFGLDTAGGMFFDPLCVGSGGSFGGPGPDMANDVVATSDGGFAIVGDRAMGTGYNSIFLVKMMGDCAGTGVVTNDSIFVTGLPELETELSIYPNPSSGQFSVNIQSPDAILNFYSISGQLLGSHTLSAGNNEVNCQLSAGVYIVQLESSAGVWATRLVIQR